MHMGISMEIPTRPNTVMDYLRERYMKERETAGGVKKTRYSCDCKVDVDGRTFTPGDQEAYGSFMESTRLYGEEIVH